LEDESLEAKSVNRKISAVRAFYRYKLKIKELTVNPTLTIHAPKIPKKLPQYVEQKDMEHLFSDIPFEESFEGLRDRTILELFYATGMRLSELLNVKIQDIHLQDNTIKVLGKRNKERIIPFGNKMEELLTMYLENLEKMGDCSIDGIFSPLDELQRRCDIITFHTPLTRDGQWPTWHLCDQAFLDGLDHCRLIIDAARGPIADNAALLSWHGDVALDCWENEPNISRELLEKAIVATPHIAGYSAEGKQRGTAMMLAALNDFFGWSIPIPTIASPTTGAAQVTLDGIASSYDILADTARLKASPETFEQQRNSYTLREETR
jgi:erythronate-4-phosphate dehydrogenase